MRSRLTIIVAYAVVFAPGCRQLPSSSLQNAENTSIVNQMRAQLSTDQKKGFDAILKNRNQSLGKVNLYASFGKTAIQKVSPESLKNLDSDKPIVDKNGNVVSRFFIQSKTGNQTSILGVRFINQLKKRQRALVIVEDLKLRAQYAPRRAIDLSQYSTKDFKRIKGVPLDLNLKVKDQQSVRKDARTSAQALKALLASFAQKIKPKGLGLTTQTSIVKTAFAIFGVILGILLMAIGGIVVAVSLPSRFYGGNLLILAVGLIIAFLGGLYIRQSLE